MSNSNKTSISVKNLNKSFHVANGEVSVLKNITFEIHENEFTIIYGPSGCGKSTLLHTILGLEEPTSGEINVLGEDIFKEYSEDKLADFRKRNVGMVYQQPNWVKAINVLENVAMPLALLGIEYNERISKAEEMLTSVHMQDWSKYHPSELSSGQQQKVALARALIANPRIIIADEPTGNLDFESGEELMDMLKKISLEKDRTVLMVTHDLEYLKYGEKAINLFDGKIQSIFSPTEKDLIKLPNTRKIHESYKK